MYKECEKVIDYFNNQLDEKERENFEEHLKSCPDCQEELEELRALTEDLPYSADPVEPPSGMKDRVLGEVFAADDKTEEPEKKRETVVPLSDNRTSTEENARQVPQKKSKVPLGMLTLAAALVASLIGNVYFISNDEPTVTAPEESTDQVLERVQLQGETEASASAAVINQNDERVLVVQADNLQPLEGDEVYQVWLLKGETPYRAGTFKSNEQGEGAVAFSMEMLEESEWDAIAVSKEPDASSQTPQGDVLMVSEL
ncbi:anti-sigma factor [Thalassobacillus hwangdonensis]|uniref:Anti-sigma-W factor RsiW n=1 Tax=Thalassobacillus hwangdonensis TaxID=546108 RepID=A0ABW3L114_9BACI